MSAARVPLAGLIRGALFRRFAVSIDEPVGLPVPDSFRFVDDRGPFYENRRTRRLRGERGHTCGYGELAPSLKTRRTR